MVKRWTLVEAWTVQRQFETETDAKKSVNAILRLLTVAARGRCPPQACNSFVTGDRLTLADKSRVVTYINVSGEITWVVANIGPCDVD